MTKPLPHNMGRFKHRRGRCYELAFSAMLRDERAKSEAWLLVHGVKQGYDHAWIVSRADGLVYDAVAHCWTLQSLYENNATAEASYTYEQAARLAVDTRHYGRWHKA